MNINIPTEPPKNQLPEGAREIARQAPEVARPHGAGVAAKDFIGVVGEVAKDIADATKDAAHRATDAAKEAYQTAAVKAGDTLETSKQYVRRNPAPVVLAAIAVGAVIGYLLVKSRRTPTFGERYVEEPLGSARDAILKALAPVAQRAQEGYDSARGGAGMALDRVRRSGVGRTLHSLSGQIGRAGGNLRF